MMKSSRVRGFAVGTAAATLTTVFALAPAVQAAPAASRSGPSPAQIADAVHPHPLRLTHHAASSFAAGPAANSTLDSYNWAGYFSYQPGYRFRYVAAQFFVPYLDCSAVSPTDESALSAHWVGLDGVTNSTVEQAGVLAGCFTDGTNVTPVYEAWYEMYPKFPVVVSLTVNPGDSIKASVYWSRSNSRFHLTLSDTTTGHSYSHSVYCAPSACERRTAEVISEAPNGSSSTSGIYALANFHAESYGGAAVTDLSGQHGAISSSLWADYRVVQLGQDNTTVLDQPTALFDGSTFGDYWMAAAS